MNYFDKFDLKRLENLELLAKQVVEGFIIGLHKSPFHGFSVEFAEHRLYNQGESTRNIDWKVYARTDKMFTKKYEEETNLRCQIVMDTSSSMFYPQVKVNESNKLNKFQFASLGAASLMNLLRKQRDAFGLSLFSNELTEHIKPKSSNTHYKLLLSKLSSSLSLAEQGRSTAAAETLHQIAERIHKRSLVLIFSDMMERKDEEEELFNALQHLKYNKHEVVLFHVHDKKTEIDFSFQNRPYEFIDLESEKSVKIQPKEIKDFYTTQMRAYIERLKMKCLKYKIDFIPCDVKEGYNQILLSYLVKRSKMRT